MPRLYRFDFDNTIMVGHVHNTMSGAGIKRSAEVPAETRGEAAQTVRTKMEELLQVGEAEKTAGKDHPMQIQDPEGLAKTFKDIIDNGDKISIESYSNYPEAMDVVLTKVFMTPPLFPGKDPKNPTEDDKKNIKEMMQKHMVVVHGFPHEESLQKHVNQEQEKAWVLEKSSPKAKNQNEWEKIGKELHTREAVEQFAAKGVSFDKESILIDDSQANVKQAGKNAILVSRTKTRDGKQPLTNALADVARILESDKNARFEQSTTPDPVVETTQPTAQVQPTQKPTAIPQTNIPNSIVNTAPQKSLKEQIEEIHTEIMDIRLDITDRSRSLPYQYNFEAPYNNPDYNTAFGKLVDPKTIAGKTYLDELNRLDGIAKQMASDIYVYLHDSRNLKVTSEHVSSGIQRREAIKQAVKAAEERYIVDSNKESNKQVVEKQPTITSTAMPQPNIPSSTATTVTQESLDAQAETIRQRAKKIRANGNSIIQTMNAKKRAIAQRNRQNPDLDPQRAYSKTAQDSILSAESVMSQYLDTFKPITQENLDLAIKECEKAEKDMADAEQLYNAKTQPAVPIVPVTTVQQTANSTAMPQLSISPSTATTVTQESLDAQRKEIYAKAQSLKGQSQGIIANINTGLKHISNKGHPIPNDYDAANVKSALSNLDLLREEAGKVAKDLQNKKPLTQKDLDLAIEQCTRIEEQVIAEGKKAMLAAGKTVEQAIDDANQEAMNTFARVAIANSVQPPTPAASVVPVAAVQQTVNSTTMPQPNISPSITTSPVAPPTASQEKVATNTLSPQVQAIPTAQVPTPSLDSATKAAAAIQSASPIQDSMRTTNSIERPNANTKAKSGSWKQIFRDFFQGILKKFGNAPKKEQPTSSTNNNANLSNNTTATNLTENTSSTTVGTTQLEPRSQSLTQSAQHAAATSPPLNSLVPPQATSTQPPDPKKKSSLSSR